MLKQVVLFELISDYLAKQNGIEKTKKSSWYGRISTHFTEKEVSDTVYEATGFLNEYLNWMQLEELDFLASQDQDSLEEFFTDEDHLDYPVSDIFEKFTHRIENQKKQSFPFHKLKRKDN